jgi:hypothetical protein
MTTVATAKIITNRANTVSNRAAMVVSRKVDTVKTTTNKAASNTASNKDMV